MTTLAVGSSQILAVLVRDVVVAVARLARLAADARVAVLDRPLKPQPRRSSRSELVSHAACMSTRSNPILIPLACLGMTPASARPFLGHDRRCRPRRSCGSRVTQQRDQRKHCEHLILCGCGSPLQPALVAGCLLCECRGDWQPLNEAFTGARDDRASVSTLDSAFALDSHC